MLLIIEFLGQAQSVLSKEWNIEKIKLKRVVSRGDPTSCARRRRRFCTENGTWAEARVFRKGLGGNSKVDVRTELLGYMYVNDWVRSSIWERAWILWRECSRFLVLIFLPPQASNMAGCSSISIMYSSYSYYPRHGRSLSSTWAQSAHQYIEHSSVTCLKRPYHKEYKHL